MGLGIRIRPIHIPPGCLLLRRGHINRPLPCKAVEVCLSYIINKVRLTKWHQSPWC